MRDDTHVPCLQPSLDKGRAAAAEGIPNQRASATPGIAKKSLGAREGENDFDDTNNFSKANNGMLELVQITPDQTYSVQALVQSGLVRTGSPTMDEGARSKSPSAISRTESPRSNGSPARSGGSMRPMQQALLANVK